MKARFFLADCGKIPLSHNVPLGEMFAPWDIFNWLFDDVTKEAKDTNTPQHKPEYLSESSFKVLGLTVHRHDEKFIRFVSIGGSADIHFDPQTKKILRWTVQTPTKKFLSKKEPK